MEVGEPVGSFVVGDRGMILALEHKAEVLGEGCHFSLPLRMWLGVAYGFLDAVSLAAPISKFILVGDELADMRESRYYVLCLAKH